MKRLLPLLAVVLVLIAVVVLRRDDQAANRYTGFVEGEERVLRSEVAGRVAEVLFHEGEPVPPDAVIARLDAADITARVASKRREIEVLARQIEQSTMEADLKAATWTTELATREAELSQARADVDLAARTAAREENLGRSGATTRQMLDDTLNRLAAARSNAERAAQMVERIRAEEASISVAKARVEVLRGQKALAESQLAELEVTHAKFEIRAPSVATVVQTQLLWPGELAQPGTALVSVLDPRDKYVQIYVPVPDLGRFRLGTPVSIELDSEPGKRHRGEVSFIADRANFTPEKIETRADRVGQVYRVKVRVLEDVEKFTPGGEGDVYLLEGDAGDAEAGR